MSVTPETLRQLGQGDAQPGWISAIADFIRRRPLGAIGAAIVLLMVFAAATAGIIAPYDPLETDYGALLAAPDAAHWLGTDAFGRDVRTQFGDPGGAARPSQGAALVDGRDGMRDRGRIPEAMLRIEGDRVVETHDRFCETPET